jgi:SAM-dependent methyltransferase
LAIGRDALDEKSASEGVVMNSFEKWQRKNPSKSFKDFFAETTEKKLRKGQAHASLGPNLLGNNVYGISGRDYFERLLSYGLKPEDTCVDYGCGTLRLGIHVIDYLGAGAYWGLDISDFLLDEGRKLIGEDRWEAKKPNLRVISAQSVAEVAAAKPSMLFSSKVLIHVHPDGLAEYVGNIMAIIGSTGKAIVTGKWTENDTVKYSSQSWLHRLANLENLVKARGGTLEVLKQFDSKVEQVDASAKWGTLQISASGVHR